MLVQRVQSTIESEFRLSHKKRIISLILAQGVQNMIESMHLGDRTKATRDLGYLCVACCPITPTMACQNVVGW